MKKYIVTNKSCLKKKYLNDFATIQAAFTPLIVADQKAGITTTVVYMDDDAQMSSLKATSIKSPTDEKQTKEAIDSLFVNQNPDFMTIFGASDVVTFQYLTNPTTDSDMSVPSDLPYACSAGYSKSINSFLAPSRDITRLPDMEGGTDSTYPLRILANAANLLRRQAQEYKNSYFAVTAAVWQGSTTITLNHIFGNTANMNVSPPAGPKWSNAQIQSLSHFFNLHGGSNNPSFYNDDGTNKKPCISSKDFNGITENMVIAAECCYGAQLYNPNSNPMGICSSAMYAGCMGYFGSTCIAYGASNSQSSADIITEKFYLHLLDGKTVGQAALSARLDFIIAASMAVPSALKTLGEFVVYGTGGFAPMIKKTTTIRDTLEQQGFKFAPENLKDANAKTASALEGMIETGKLLTDKEPPEIVKNVIDAIVQQTKPDSYSVSCNQVIPGANSKQADADQVFIYTVLSTIKDEDLGDSYVMHHIKATNEHIIDVFEEHSK